MDLGSTEQELIIYKHIITRTLCTQLSELTEFVYDEARSRDVKDDQCP